MVSHVRSDPAAYPCASAGSPEADVNSMLRCRQRSDTKCRSSHSDIHTMRAELNRWRSGEIPRTPVIVRPAAMDRPGVKPMPAMWRAARLGVELQRGETHRAIGNKAPIELVDRSATKHPGFGSVQGQLHLRPGSD
jgi:hypothetical protein